MLSTPLKKSNLLPSFKKNNKSACMPKPFYLGKKEIFCSAWQDA